MHFQEMETRLAELGRQSHAVLSFEQRESYDLYVEVGEYGLALDMLADWLSEDDTPISEAFRSEALLLARETCEVGVAEHVERVLAFCPDRAEGLNPA